MMLFFSDLHLCDGPACPSCGCRDCEIIQPAGGGLARGVAVCGHCGVRFSFLANQDGSTTIANGQAEADTTRRSRRRRRY